jgi:penicillin-binding protein 1A
VYGAALEKGMAPEHPYLDAVLDIKAGDGTVWRPTDMSGTSGRQLTLRDGLVYSKNTITAQVMQDVGLPRIVKLARDLGVKHSKLDSVPSLALGTSPVTLLEMVNAYATIAAQGEYRKPVFITRITDRAGNVVAEFGGEAGQRAMPAESAAALTDMMRGVIDRGTGGAVRHRFGIAGDVAGKTGTTQNNADGWFILMHPNLVAGAWVGFNDARVTMRSNYWGQGGHNAILLVGDFFKSAIDSGKVDPAAQFPGGRPPAKARAQEEPEEVMEGPDDIDQEGAPPPEAEVDEPEFGPLPEVLTDRDRERQWEQQRERERERQWEQQRERERERQWEQQRERQWEQQRGGEREPEPEPEFDPEFEPRFEPAPPPRPVSGAGAAPETYQGR